MSWKDSASKKRNNYPQLSDFDYVVGPGKDDEEFWIYFVSNNDSDIVVRAQGERSGWDNDGLIIGAMLAAYGWAVTQLPQLNKNLDEKFRKDWAKGAVKRDLLSQSYGRDEPLGPYTREQMNTFRREGGMKSVLSIEDVWERVKQPIDERIYQEAERDNWNPESNAVKQVEAHNRVQRRWKNFMDFGIYADDVPAGSPRVVHQPGPASQAIAGLELKQGPEGFRLELDGQSLTPKQEASFRSEVLNPEGGNYRYEGWEKRVNKRADAWKSKNLKANKGGISIDVDAMRQAREARRAQQQVQTYPIPEQAPQRFGAPANGPIQGPETLQPPVSPDLGRDAARQIVDQRVGRQQLDFPSASTPIDELQSMMTRQETLQADARGQVANQRGVPITNELPPKPKNLVQRPTDTKFSSKSPDRISNVVQQGPLMPQQQGPGFNDLGREDARVIRENTSINTRYVDKPLADPKMMEPAADLPRVQQTSYQAPDTPKPVLAKSKGGIKMAMPSRRATIADAALGVAADLAGHYIKPHADRFLNDQVLKPLIKQTTGRDIMSYDALMEADAYRKGVPAQDAANQAAYDARVAEGNRPIAPGEAPPAPALPPEPQEQQQTQRQAPQPFKGGRKIRKRSSAQQQDPQLVSKATERDLINQHYDQLRQTDPEAAERYGLEQHKKLYPNLY